MATKHKVMELSLGETDCKIRLLRVLKEMNKKLVVMLCTDIKEQSAISNIIAMVEVIFTSPEIIHGDFVRCVKLLKEDQNFYDIVIVDDARYEQIQKYRNKEERTIPLSYIIGAAGVGAGNSMSGGGGSNRGIKLLGLKSTD
jgi:hypothetical protein